MSSEVWSRKSGRQRIAALIVSLGLAFSVGGCTYEEPDGERPLPGSAFPVPSSSESELSVAPRQGWGPGALFFTDAGNLYVGENRWPPARVASFTMTSTGVVYVDAETSRLVWADSENSIRRLGWLEPKETRAGRQWGEFRDIRDIVGNPSHDLVSWVQRGAYSGDIVVVRPSTGEVLAQAAIPSLAAEKSVVYGSIDDAAVYYATSPGGGVTGDVWFGGGPPAKLLNGATGPLPMSVETFGRWRGRIASISRTLTELSCHRSTLPMETGRLSAVVSALVAGFMPRPMA